MRQIEGCVPGCLSFQPEQKPLTVQLPKWANRWRSNTQSVTGFVFFPVCVINKDGPSNINICRIHVKNVHMHIESDVFFDPLHLDLLYASTFMRLGLIFAMFWVTLLQAGQGVFLSASLQWVHSHPLWFDNGNTWDTNPDNNVPFTLNAMSHESSCHTLSVQPSHKRPTSHTPNTAGILS